MKRLPGPLRREVFNRRNTQCGINIMDCADLPNWWTDGGDEGIYLKITNCMDNTIHRAYPRPIPGRVCRRLEMRDGDLYWLYDKAGKPKQEDGK